LLVMAVGAGPLSNREDIFVSEKVGFSPIQVAPQRTFFVFVLFLIEDKGFFISGGNFMKRWRILK